MPKEPQARPEDGQQLEEEKEPNKADGQIIFDESLQYRIIKTKITIKHPWKEVDWDVQCDYEGESIDNIPHGLGKISLISS